MEQAGWGGDDYEYKRIDDAFRRYSDSAVTITVPGVISSPETLLENSNRLKLVWSVISCYYSKPNDKEKLGEVDGKMDCIFDEAQRLYNDITAEDGNPDQDRIYIHIKNSWTLFRRINDLRFAKGLAIKMKSSLTKDEKAKARKGAATQMEDEDDEPTDPASKAVYD